MNFSKSHFINELKKTNDALHESISNSLDSTILNEAKSEDWDDVDTLQDFSVLISKIVKGVLPNLVKLKPKTKKEFEKLLATFKNGLDDISESEVNEADKYDTKEFKVGDKIKTNFGVWEVIETDYKPGKSFIAPFIFKGKDMKRLNIPNPPKTNKNAVGYKVTDGGKYPITGFLYQYNDITKLATVGVDESVNELDSAGHPSRIRLRDPETAKLNRINALYDAYMNLAKHMESSGAPQDKIDLMKLKASDLMTHIKDM
jgi:hypothetical protein